MTLEKLCKDTIEEGAPLYKCVLPNKNNPQFAYLIVKREEGLLFVKETNVPSNADLFTEEEAREQLDWITPYMERVK